MIIGNYRLFNRIGEGANSQVFKAERMDTGEEVAVKTYSTAKAAIIDMSVTKCVDHPNVIRYSDIFLAPYNDDYVLTHRDYTDNKPKHMICIAMPLMDGSLYDLHKLKSRVNVDVLTKDLFEGLMAIHDKGFIFCDISIGNILYKVVGDSIQVKFTDFEQSELINFGGRRFRSEDELRSAQAYELNWLSQLIIELVDIWNEDSESPIHFSDETLIFLDRADKKTLEYNTNTDNFVVPVSHTSGAPDWTSRRTSKIMKRIAISNYDMEYALDFIEYYSIVQADVGNKDTLFDYLRIAAVALWFSLGKKYIDFCVYIFNKDEVSDISIPLSFDLFKSLDFNIYKAIGNSLRQHSTIDTVLRWE